MPRASPQAEMQNLRDRIARKRRSHQSTGNEEARLHQLCTQQLRREVRAMKRKRQ